MLAAYAERGRAGESKASHLPSKRKGAFEACALRPSAATPQMACFVFVSRSALSTSLSLHAEACSPGTGGAKCTTCAVGTWSAGGNGTVDRPACQACPTGSTNNKTGGSSLAECNSERASKRGKLCAASSRFA